MVYALNFPLDRLETVNAKDLPQGDTGGGLQAAPSEPASKPEPFDKILARWLVLSKPPTRSTAAWVFPTSTPL